MRDTDQDKGDCSFKETFRDALIDKLDKPCLVKLYVRFDVMTTLQIVEGSVSFGKTELEYRTRIDDKLDAEPLSGEIEKHAAHIASIANKAISNYERVLAHDGP